MGSLYEWLGPRERFELRPLVTPLVRFRPQALSSRAMHERSLNLAVPLASCSLRAVAFPTKSSRDRVAR